MLENARSEPETLCWLTLLLDRMSEKAHVWTLLFDGVFCVVFMYCVTMHVPHGLHIAINFEKAMLYSSNGLSQY